MLDVKIPNATVGVIVGRFQLHELHSAHIELIETVINNHPRTVILLGVSPVRSSINDPLNWEIRKSMILEKFPPNRYPNLHIGYIFDQPSDKIWSQKFDQIISELLGPRDSVLAYGGRDSFLKRYSGKFKTIELEPKTLVSATEIRNKLSTAPITDPMFRAGVIYSTFQRFDTVYSTVDVLLYDKNKNAIWLGRKSNDPAGQYRLAGGFVDPKDESFEAAANREVYEEMNVIPGALYHVGSQRVDDWRYANNPNEKIITTLYVGSYSHGCIAAGDDLAEVKQFSLDGFDPNVHVVSQHVELVKKGIEYIRKNLSAAKI